MNSQTKIPDELILVSKATQFRPRKPAHVKLYRSGKNAKLEISVKAVEATGLKSGDYVRIYSDGNKQLLVIEKVEKEDEHTFRLRPPYKSHKTNRLAVAGRALNVLFRNNEESKVYFIYRGSEGNKHLFERIDRTIGW